MILPTTAEVRAWAQVPASAVSDEQLTLAIAAEVALQESACRVPPEPDLEVPELRQAIYRRVARHVAARGVPLGMMGADSEYGPARLSLWDAEVGRLEGPRRIVVFA